MLNQIVDSLQEKFPPNRLCVLLTPLVFVPAAAAISGWLAAHVPGLGLDAGEILGFALAGALSALTLAYKWLDQWQRTEGAVQPSYEGALNWTEDPPSDPSTSFEVTEKPESGLTIVNNTVGVPIQAVVGELLSIASAVEEGATTNADVVRDLNAIADDLAGQPRSH